MVCPSPDRCHTSPPALLWALSAPWAHQRGAMFPKKLAQGHAACGACVFTQLRQVMPGPPRAKGQPPPKANENESPYDPFLCHTETRSLAARAHTFTHIFTHNLVGSNVQMSVQMCVRRNDIAAIADLQKEMKVIRRRIFCVTRRRIFVGGFPRWIPLGFQLRQAMPAPPRAKG